MTSGIFLLIMIFFISCSGSRPLTLGVVNGKLSDCPATPNCVNSFASETDDIHFISPLKIQDSTQNIVENLKSLLLTLDRVKIINHTENYMYAEFTSKYFRFVDDVEFYLDADNKLIHVRSASRLGSGDLGVNRKRIEEIRRLLVLNK